MQALWRRAWASCFWTWTCFQAHQRTSWTEVGDLCLQDVSNRLRRCVRTSDSLCRLGGDEFTIIIENAKLPEHAIHVGRRILESLAEPFFVRGHRLHIAVSIGVALYPDDGVEPDILLGQADAAMYRAKNSGGNRCEFFDPAGATAAA